MGEHAALQVELLPVKVDQYTVMNVRDDLHDVYNYIEILTFFNTLGIKEA